MQPQQATRQDFTRHETLIWKAFKYPPTACMLLWIPGAVLEGLSRLNTIRAGVNETPGDQLNPSKCNQSSKQAANTVDVH